jgi:adenylyl- and sulfurtransferase ThiI
MIHELIRQQEIISSSAPIAVVEDLLCHVFGVAALDRVVVLCDELNPSEVAKSFLSRDEKVGKARSFGVRVRRVGESKQWNSQSFSAAVGSALQAGDDSLSVNLREPDMWVKLIMEHDRVSLVEKRIQGAGGLPSGVQGDVLIQIKNRDDMLGAFLIMRRGTRLIPVLDCDDISVRFVVPIRNLAARNHFDHFVSVRINHVVPKYFFVSYVRHRDRSQTNTFIMPVAIVPISRSGDEKLGCANSIEKILIRPGAR